MDKKSDNNLIKIYNSGVREQEKAFGGNKGLCPYFKIDTNTIKKLNTETLQIGCKPCNFYLPILVK